jgi:hypothetical protein
MEKNRPPIDFSTEKIKRHYLREFIADFLNMIRRGELDGDDVTLAQEYINKARAAIKDLNGGDPTLAKEILDFDIQRKEAWKRSFIEPTKDAERISEAEQRIAKLKELRDQL